MLFYFADISLKEDFHSLTKVRHVKQDENNKILFPYIRIKRDRYQEVIIPQDLLFRRLIAELMATKNKHYYLNFPFFDLSSFPSKVAEDRWSTLVTVPTCPERTQIRQPHKEDMLYLLEDTTLNHGLPWYPKYRLPHSYPLSEYSLRDFWFDLIYHTDHNWHICDDYRGENYISYLQKTDPFDPTKEKTKMGRVFLHLPFAYKDKRADEVRLLNTKVPLKVIYYYFATEDSKMSREYWEDVIKSFPRGLSSSLVLHIPFGYFTLSKTLEYQYNHNVQIKTYRNA